MSTVATPFGPDGPVGYPMQPARSSSPQAMLPDIDDAEAVRSEGGIDFRSLWSTTYRNRFLIAAIVGIALLIGLAVTLLSTPMYRARATIQIEQQGTQVLEGQDLDPGALREDTNRFLQTQLDLLRSRSLAERVVDNLQLQNNPQLRALLELPTQGSLSAERSQQVRQQAIGMLKGGVSTVLPRDSRVVQVSFDSQDPALAALVANAFVENFITFNLQRKLDSSSYARSFLSDQLAETKGRLETSERAVIAYARAANLIDPASGAGNVQSPSGRSSLTTSSLISINDSLSAAVNDRIAAEQRWQQAQSTAASSLPEVLADSAIQALYQQRAQLQASYAEDLQRRQADFPTMRQAAARLAELEKQINQQSSNVKNSIRNQYQVALQRERELQRAKGSLEQSTLSEQDRAVRYNILRREVDTNRTMYEGLLQRFKEISAAAGVTPNNISIVDSAQVPSAPVYPRPTANLVLAGLSGLILALFITFAREAFDDAIRSPDDIGRKLGLTFLGSIPLLPNNADARVELADQRSDLSEAYYAFRTAIEFASAGGLPSSILVTSSQPSEGKSTSSFALALALANVGKRTLLIDIDLRKPTMHRLLEMPNKVGLTNLLTMQASIEAAVQATEIPNLSFIACGPRPPNPAELLANPSLVEVLRILEHRYDAVVLDGPPVLGLADAPLISSKAQATIFVIEANRAHRGHAKSALKRLRSSHGHLLGALLTKFDARTIGYYSQYGYSYSYRYGSRDVGE